MSTEPQHQQQGHLDWLSDLPESLWFHIGHYLTLNDIHRLSRTCSRLHLLFTSHDFWSYLIRRQFGHAIWYRLIKTSSLAIDEKNFTRSKSIYFQLNQRQRISFSHVHLFSLDTNRRYRTIPDPSSLTGDVLYIKDSIEFCYSLHLETKFENILPGKYEVIWRMKLHLPYMLGETEFFAVPEQINPGRIAYMRWTQEDFLSMYQCFHCDLTSTNLWFYQTIGFVEIHGEHPCCVYISMINNDSIHAKQGMFLDYVELKLCRE